MKHDRLIREVHYELDQLRLLPETVQALTEVWTAWLRTLPA